MTAALAPAARRESRHQPRLCRSCQRPMSRQEDACWRCGARVRHVQLRGRQVHHGMPPPARPPRRVTHSPAPHGSPSRQRDALPSRAEIQARSQAERAAGERRRQQAQHELVTAIGAGDAAYRRLSDRLDDFGTRLAAARLTLRLSPRA